MSRTYAALLTLAAALATSCAAPTTYGLRTDGYLPEVGQPELLAHGGYVYEAHRTDVDGDGTDDGDGTLYHEGSGGGGGSDLVIALSDRTALSLASGFGFDRFSSGIFGAAEVRYRTGPDPDARFTGTVISGVGANYWPQETWGLGMHGGGLVTYNAHPVRVYVGGKLNLVGGDWLGGFPMFTVGTSVRPFEHLVIGVECTAITEMEFWRLPSATFVPTGYAGWRF